MKFTKQTQALRLVRQHNGQTADQDERDTDLLLGALYQALAQREKRKRPEGDKCFYHPAFSNTDHSLERLTQVLACRRAARICLAGPPGTGKTRFAQHLAVQLQRPLMVENASNLRDISIEGVGQSWVDAVAEARRRNAVLVIDNADNLLADLFHTQYQMDGYEGILVLAVQSREPLSARVRRYFDFHVCFNFLNPEQTWMLFNHLLGRCDQEGGVLALSKNMRSALDQLNQLTPADFRRVEQQYQLSGQRLTPEGLLLGLQQEHAKKTHRQFNVTGCIK